MSRLATSTTRSEAGTLNTFASLRIMGDRLEPAKVTAVIGRPPETAYRKDEVYKRSRGHEVRGRTGLWLHSSEGHVDSLDLTDHLAYLRDLLFSSSDSVMVERLRALMRGDELEADVSCFWYGERGAKPPVIPEEIRAAFALIGAAIETDFDTD